jgi:hypothetical protein
MLLTPHDLREDDEAEVNRLDDKKRSEVNRLYD